MPSFFDEILEKLGSRAVFLIVIFGELPKGEILEKTSKNGRILKKSHPKIRVICA
jgi:hypothetical protein